MAVQTTPHTNTEQDVNTADMDLEPNMNPQDTYRSDPALYENSDGAQTAGNRSFHTNEMRDSQPKSIDEGTANTASDRPNLPQSGGTGVTSHSADAERATQEKVVNS